MTDATVAQPGTVALEPPSTVLNPETVSTTSGGGKVDVSTPDKGASIEDTLTAELSRLRSEDKDDKPDTKAKDEKPEPEEKAEAKPERARSDKGQFATSAKPAKPANAEVAEVAGDPAAPERAQDGQGGQAVARQSEGRSYAEPPARLTPDEAKHWANVPNTVKAGLARMAQEDDAEKQTLRTASQQYERLREFDDLARTNGRDLRDSLMKMHRIDEMIGRDPIGALDEVLREIGPRRSDGQPLTIYDVANYVIQNGPEAYQQRAQATREASANSEIAALRQEVESMRTYQAASAVENTVIAPFAAQHPRFHELQDDIAMFLQSGKIPASLSHQDRLSQAYAMAERLNPRSSGTVQDDPPSAPARPADRLVDPAGQKSIRGAPDSGFDPVIEDTDTDIATLLRKEYRRMAS